MPQADWSRAERWVWDQVCAGKVADFHKRFGKLDPRFGAGWGGEDRLLRPIFIREIFYEKPLAEKIPPEGVRIMGACFRDKLALSNGRLHTHLWLDYCRFHQGIDFSAQRIEGWLSLYESFLAKPADDSAAVDLTAAKIDGSLNLSLSTIEGRLMMNGLQVDQNLFMESRKGLQANLFMETNTGLQASFAEVDLSGANIKGQLSLAGAAVTGRLMMTAVQVGGDLLMQSSDDDQPCQFDNDVDLSFATITGMLGLFKAKFAGRRLDISGAKIGGELRLDHVQWGPEVSMILRNAQSSVLHEEGGWPKIVELHGLTYDRIGGVGEAESETLGRKDFRKRYSSSPTCSAKEGSQRGRPTSSMRAASGQDRRLGRLGVISG